MNAWVAYGFGTVFGVGIVAAVALPAYQDYQKRQAAAAKPVQSPAPQLDLSEFQKAPNSLTGTGGEKGAITQSARRSEIEDFLNEAPKTSQTATWSGNSFDKLDSVNEIAARARQFPQLNEPRAWVIPPFCSAARSRTVTQPWPVAALG
ncbi:MAG: hypothetical protein U1E84_05520 [Rhodoferax sp.]